MSDVSLSKLRGLLGFDSNLESLKCAVEAVRSALFSDVSTPLLKCLKEWRTLVLSAQERNDKLVIKELDPCRRLEMASRMALDHVSEMMSLQWQHSGTLHSAKVMRLEQEQRLLQSHPSVAELYLCNVTALLDLFQIEKRVRTDFSPDRNKLAMVKTGLISAQKILVETQGRRSNDEKLSDESLMNPAISDLKCSLLTFDDARLKSAQSNLYKLWAVYYSIRGNPKRASKQLEKGVRLKVISAGEARSIRIKQGLPSAKGHSRSDDHSSEDDSMYDSSVETVRECSGTDDSPMSKPKPSLMNAKRNHHHSSIAHFDRDESMNEGGSAGLVGTEDEDEDDEEEDDFFEMASLRDSDETRRLGPSAMEPTRVLLVEQELILAKERCAPSNRESSADSMDVDMDLDMESNEEEGASKQDCPVGGPETGIHTRDWTSSTMAVTTAATATRNHTSFGMSQRKRSNRQPRSVKPGPLTPGSMMLNGTARKPSHSRTAGLKKDDDHPNHNKSPTFKTPGVHSSSMMPHTMEDPKIPVMPPIKEDSTESTTGEARSSSTSASSSSTSSSTLCTIRKSQRSAPDSIAGEAGCSSVSTFRKQPTHQSAVPVHRQSVFPTVLSDLRGPESSSSFRSTQYDRDTPMPEPRNLQSRLDTGTRVSGLQTDGTRPQTAAAMVSRSSHRQSISMVPVSTLKSPKLGRKTTVSRQARRSPRSVCPSKLDSDRKAEVISSSTSVAKKSEQTTLQKRLVPRKKKPRMILMKEQVYCPLVEIGRGGSSQVWRVMRKSDDQIFAAKIITIKNPDSGQMDGFRNEIALLEGLKGHKHIVELIDWEISYVLEQTVTESDSAGVITTQNRFVSKRISEEKAKETIAEVSGDCELRMVLPRITMIFEVGEIDLAQMLKRSRIRAKQKLRDQRGMGGDGVPLGPGYEHIPRVDSIFDSVHIDGRDYFYDLILIKYCWKQMLEAVQVIHQERIVHGDLKPANFLMVRGELKLIDFGIAKAIESDMTTSIIRHSQIGTLNYMSPEAIIEAGCGAGSSQSHSMDGGGESISSPNANENDGSNSNIFKLSRKADVWSLGCILHQMFYGGTPFSKLSNLISKIRAITCNDNRQIRSLILQNAKLQYVNDIIADCLDVDARDRPSLSQLINHPFLKSGNCDSDHPSQSHRKSIEGNRRAMELCFKMSKQIMMDMHKSSELRINRDVISEAALDRKLRDYSRRLLTSLQPLL